MEAGAAARANGQRMKAGTVLKLVKKWTHQAEDATFGFELNKNYSTIVLLLELEHNFDSPFDLDAAMAKIGYVKTAKGVRDEETAKQRERIEMERAEKR